MNLNSRPLIATFATLALMAGCQQQAEPAKVASAPPPAAEAAPPPPEMPSAANAASGAYEAFVPSGPALDQRAFAGHFAGILPCATCPGIETDIELKDDYSFILTETFQASKDAGPFKTKGTWTAEEDGHLLRLDPDSKSDNDRLYQVLANDEIKLLDADGKPLVGTVNFSLHRVGH